jgi:hypothetical protein
MPILYNCHHSGDQYRITKFDEDMNPQGSYLVTLDECDCPASVRPTCRHRQMLPKFLARSHVGDEWFYDFDRGGWVQEEVIDVHNSIANAVGEPPAPAKFPRRL